MSGLGVSAENDVLNAVLRGTAYPVLAVARMSLHSADPGDAGANEVINVGSSTYARQACAFNASGNGRAYLTAPVTFTFLPSGSVLYLGLWTLAGEFRGSLASGLAAALVFGASVIIGTDTYFEVIRKVD